MSQQMEQWPDCPSCGALWTIDELQDNTCYGCGYPEGEEEEEDDED